MNTTNEELAAKLEDHTKHYLIPPYVAGNLREAATRLRAGAGVDEGMVERLRQIAHDVMAIQTDPRLPSSERVKAGVIAQIEALTPRATNETEEG